MSIGRFDTLEPEPTLQRIGKTGNQRNSNFICSSKGHGEDRDWTTGGSTGWNGKALRDRTHSVSVSEGKMVKTEEWWTEVTQKMFVISFFYWTRKIFC